MIDLAIRHPVDKWLGLLQPFIAHVHVKDVAIGTPNTCFAGAGDGQIAELVAASPGARNRGNLSGLPET